MDAATEEWLAPHIETLQLNLFHHVPPEIVSEAHIAMHHARLIFVDDLGDRYILQYREGVCTGVIQVAPMSSTLWREGAAVQHYEPSHG